MLRGLDANRIVVGAYADPRSGGICPMLAAHRNGGRTSVAGFARAWDAYTGARRPRQATRREVGTLRTLLEHSIRADDDTDRASIAELAAQIRAEREHLAGCASPTTGGDSATGTVPDSGTAPAEPAAVRRNRQRPDVHLDLLAVAEQALAEQGTWERTVQRPASTPVSP